MSQMTDISIIMERRRSLVLGLVVLLIICLLNPTESQSIPAPIIKIDSSYFPDGFVWGTATSSYQIEGAANKYGRAPSIWDTFTHEFPENIADGSNGDVAVDFYHHYAEDIKRMNTEVGTNAYRFSISWSRVIPSGKRRGGVNEEGIDFYNRVIDETIKNGLEPFVTLFHWDLPQALEDKYEGFLSHDIVTDFKDYAELCFERFGDRVKHWITLNEPYVFTLAGYDQGNFAPGRCSSWVNRACEKGNSGTEPYIVAHHLLLAHATAVQAYKKMGQNGKIGITLDITWPLAFSDSAADIAAVQRNIDFAYGWFMDPLTYGHYPRIMRTLVSDRLPKFTREQSLLVKGSYDFIGMNYYTANYASANTSYDPDPTHIRYTTDSQVNLTKYNKDGEFVGLQMTPSWIYLVPEGLRYALNYTKDTYKDPIIYITENGVGDNVNLSPVDARKDIWRIQYFKSHLSNVLKSICEYKVRVKGYFAWSFIDNFEWTSGYTIKMGVYQADRDKNLERHAKLSVRWLNEFLKNKTSIHGPKCGLYVKPKPKSSLEDVFKEKSSLEDIEEL